MIIHEYKSEYFSTAEVKLSDSLNKQAKDGWRLVSLLTPDRNRSWYYEAVFERQKKKGS